MKPQFPERSVSSSGVLAEHSFGISKRSQAHVASILRDRLYADKPLAVLREYSSNAWDANRMVGRGDVPITVVMPTPLEASLIIRDEGPGLSEDDIHVVYTQYGESTKRDRDDAVGMLGIGSKSAFAYNDAFSITSWHGGMKTVYHAVLDESQLGKVLKVYQGGQREHVLAFVAATSPKELEGREIPNLDWVDLYDLFEVSDLSSYTSERDLYNEAMHRALGSPAEWSPPGDELFRLHLSSLVKDRFSAWVTQNVPATRTGLEIKVPIVPKDIPEFNWKARDLFRYFQPLPKINIALDPPQAKWKNDYGWISKSDQNGWILVMGCVPYRINLEQISALLEEAGYLELVSKLSGGLIVPIGAVSVAANREGLEYTQLTKESIVKGLAGLVDAVSEDLEKIITDTSKSPLQRRLEILDFLRVTNLTLPKKYREWHSPPSGVLLYSNKEVIAEALVLKKHFDQNNEDPSSLKIDVDHITQTAPKHFTLNRQAHSYGARGRQKARHLEENPHIVPSSATRILIKDVTKPWRGYVEPLDFVVKFKGEASIDQVEAELSAYLAAANLTGMSVHRMSNLTFSEPAARLGEGNPKHSQSCFRLINANKRATLSDNWESGERDEDPEDVFVVLNRFRVVSGEWRDCAFYDRFRDDTAIFSDLFGETMPTIWGLKSVESRRVHSEDVEGIEYSDWRKKALQESLSRHPELRKELECLSWVNLNLGELPYYSRTDRDQLASEEETRDWLKDNLGDSNRVVQVFSERIKSRNLLKVCKEALTKANAPRIGDSQSGFRYESSRKLFFEQTKSDSPSRAKRWLDVCYQHYPLLDPEVCGTPFGLAVLRMKNNRDHWLRYLQMIDTVSPRPAAPPRKIKTPKVQGI